MEMNVLDLGLVLFFAATAIGALAVVGSMAERREIGVTFELATNSRLGVADIERVHLAAPFLERVAAPAMTRLTAFARRITPSGLMERLEVEIVRAGLQARWDAGRVMATKLALLGLLSSGMLLLGFIQHAAPLQVLIMSAAFGFIGYYIPEWVLRGRSGKRQEAIRRSLPDALDLLAITVEAGLGFDAAVQRVASHGEGPLSEELGRMLHELQIGRSRIDALRDLGERSGVPELKAFCLAMIQADTYGISISKMLQEQAREARTARRQRAEEKAQKVQVKIVFPLLTCIFPSMFVVLLGPAMISIYESVLVG
jgi:tight adherence protein C